MDKDSAYIAIAGDRLEDILKPSMKRYCFNEEKHLWFSRVDT